MLRTGACKLVGLFTYCYDNQLYLAGNYLGMILELSEVVMQRERYEVHTTNCK